MNQNSYKDFCNIFYNTFMCPVRFIENGEKIMELPENSYPFVEQHLQTLLSSEKYISYQLTSCALFYACIQSKDRSLAIIIGPYAFHTCNHTDIINIMKEYRIPSDQIGAITDFFQITGNGTYPYCTRMISLANFFLNGENIDIDSFLGIRTSHEIKKITSKHLESMAQSKENQNFHNTYQAERVIMKKIEDGDVCYFKQGNSAIPDARIGRIADNNLRQAKNIFIVATTLSTRAAISGGLPIEEAFQLSDEYIIAAEKMLSVDAINHLFYDMTLDFTQRVNVHRIPSGLSPEIYHSIQYIQLHTNMTITVAEVADAVGISRSHLSRRFKTELGFDISSFIMRCKLEEAKSQLIYTDNSLAEISNYLCFSSQSYFTNVFKNKYGMTPKEYRYKYRKAN